MCTDKFKVEIFPFPISFCNLTLHFTQFHVIKRIHLWNWQFPSHCLFFDFQTLLCKGCRFRVPLWFSLFWPKIFISLFNFQNHMSEGVWKVILPVVFYVYENRASNLKVNWKFLWPEQCFISKNIWFYMYLRNFTYMDPCIVVWISRNNQQDAIL